MLQKTFNNEFHLTYAVSGSETLKLRNLPEHEEAILLCTLLYKHMKWLIVLTAWTVQLFFNSHERRQNLHNHSTL